MCTIALTLPHTASPKTRQKHFHYKAFSTAFWELPQRHVAFLQVLLRFFRTTKIAERNTAKAAPTGYGCSWTYYSSIQKHVLHHISLNWTRCNSFNWISHRFHSIVCNHSSTTICFRKSSSNFISGSVSQGIEYVQRSQWKNAEYVTILKTSCPSTPTSTIVSPWSSSSEDFHLHTACLQTPPYCSTCELHLPLEQQGQWACWAPLLSKFVFSIRKTPRRTWLL